MGMALDQLSAEKAITPFSNMGFKKPFFGFHLQRSKDKGDTGSLTLGGIDHSKFVGSITFSKLLDDASVNGKALDFNGKNAIIDTGTTLAVMPLQDAEKIHKQIPGATKINGQFVVPCNTKVNIAFTFAGISYNIDPRDLAFQPTGKNNYCASGISAGNIGGNTTWLVGDVFLKNVYSVFNIKDLSVGFAPSKITKCDLNN
ncbi:aspartic peptidase domain-containing protein [Gigaspora rosea]|uniref:Aspartic peptidase domain-containing protein n=1 Tax=Gigaspora rosea TaxID=44941 RepID=A0A397W055_9GLOM|nr:aspartic peptidase domain-containing protein [Gigaspora rosea]